MNLFQRQLVQSYKILILYKIRLKGIDWVTWRCKTIQRSSCEYYVQRGMIPIHNFKITFTEIRTKADTGRKIAPLVVLISQSHENAPNVFTQSIVILSKVFESKTLFCLTFKANNTNGLLSTNGRKSGRELYETSWWAATLNWLVKLVRNLLWISKNNRTKCKVWRSRFY